MTRVDLMELYISMKNKDLCKQLGITNPTLVSLLKRNDIPLKGKGNRTDRHKINLLD